MCGFFYRKAVAHVALHVFHYHYGVVNDYPYGQNQPEKRKVVYRKSKKIHYRECSNERYRYRKKGNYRGPPVLKKNENDYYNQKYCVEYCLIYGVYGFGYVFGDVESYYVINVVREAFFHFRQFVLDSFCQFYGV